MKTFATVPGKVLHMQLSSEGGLLVYYETPKKKWQFWIPNISCKHFCPHETEWDECPDCCH
jgi:hypothetical protein